MVAGIEAAELPPEIWLPLADFSQDLSAPDPVLNCSVEWAGWETNCGMLLGTTQADTASERHHPTQITPQPSVSWYNYEVFSQGRLAQISC